MIGTRAVTMAFSREIRRGQDTLLAQDLSKVLAKTNNRQSRFAVLIPLTAGFGLDKATSSHALCLDDQLLRLGFVDALTGHLGRLGETFMTPMFCYTSHTTRL